MEIVYRLSDVLPQEFFEGEYDNSKVHSYLDCIVLKSHSDGGWVGIHKNVYCWWELDNGICVGWNENPSKGWSFVAIRNKKKTQH